MDNKMDEFKILFEQFNTINKNHVPPLMSLKLNFLARSIIKQPISENELKQLGDDQIQLFTGLQQSIKIAMYVSIVKCLIQKDLPIKEMEAQIKQDNLLSRWKICFISWNRQSLFILIEKRYNYSFKSVRLYKPSINDKRRVTFGLDVGSRKYLIGFREEKAALELLVKLRDLIRNNSEIFMNSQISLQIQQKDKKQPLQFQQMNALQNEQVEQIIQDEKSYEKVLQNCKVDELQEDNQYRIYEYLQKYEDARILIHNILHNNFKLQLMIRKLIGTNQQLLEIINNPKLWNTNILQHKIIAKVDNNIFIIYQKHRAFGYSYRERDFVYMRYVFKKQEKIYIIDKSVEHESYPVYKLVVRGQIKQRCLVLKLVKDILLIICKVQIDFGGYNGLEHNKIMGLKYLKDFCELKIYCKFKVLRQQLKNSTKLYNFQKKQNFKNLKYQKNEENQKFIDKNIIEKKSNQNNNITKTQVTNNIKSKEKLQSDQEVPLYTYMPIYLNDEISYQYVQCIRKKQHWLLPLRHFDPQIERKEFSKKQNIEPLNNFITQGGEWQINDEGQFIYRNQKVINAQKALLGYLLRQIGSQIMKGQSIMNISLPVDIFQGRSLLQRCAHSFCYAPIYLTQAGKKNQQIQQMQSVILFFLSINSLQLKMQKPFNPILGETFQCFIGNIPFYVQQISHHPPISAYYMKSKQFILYGNSMLYAQMGLNRGVGGNAGVVNIIFPSNNARYECICPSSQIVGFLYGDRILRPINKGYIINKEKKLYFEVSYGKDKKDVYQTKEKMKPSNIQGGIFRVNNEFIKRYQDTKMKYKFQGLTKKDEFHKLSRVSGVYYDKIYIDGKQMKSMFNPVPYSIQYQRHPLPSNSNFRQDIIHLRRHELALAQSQKEKLEHLQRLDKKKRTK